MADSSGVESIKVIKGGNHNFFYLLINWLIISNILIEIQKIPYCKPHFINFDKKNIKSTWIPTYF